MCSILAGVKLPDHISRAKTDIWLRFAINFVKIAALELLM